MLYSEAFASVAVVVDAKDDRARNFYERYGFVLLESRIGRLYLLMDTIAKL